MLATRDSLPPPPPFWHRLNSFFAFPFQMRPLAYGLVLSFCSLLFEGIFFLPDMIALGLIEIGIMLAASRYGFKVIALGARGLRDSADFGRESSDEWTYLPWKLFAISLVQAALIGWLAYYAPILGTVGLFVMSFTYPAAVIVLVQSGSFFQAMNPGHVMDAMRTIGWPYALLCFFLFLLSTGAQVALSLVLPMIDGRIALPIVNFAFIYFGWVMASLLGYVMFQHHEAFGFDAVPGSELDGGGPVERRTPEQIAAQRTDAEVAQLVTEGDLAGALGIAYEAQRTAASDDLAAQRRYHRVLALMPDKTATLLDHARRFVPLLMRRDLASEALKVFKVCKEKDKVFRARRRGHGHCHGARRVARRRRARHAGAAVGLRQAFSRARGDSAGVRTGRARARAGPGPRRHGAAHPGHDGGALPGQRADAGSALAAEAGAGRGLENPRFDFTATVGMRR
jgi:hypothetical protein